MERQIAQEIQQGQTVLGIEFGSTRIKAVLIGRDHAPIATGIHPWQSHLEHGHWTYGEGEIWAGLQGCVQALRQEVARCYGVALARVGGLGISGMMHGYLALDEKGQLLVPFRTWRDTTTAQAAQLLTQVLGRPIPLRWSIAHLEQAILDGEEHVARLCHLTTLAGYVHWRLTGQWVLGVGEASGMFPIDETTGSYDAQALSRYDAHNAGRGLACSLEELLPRPLPAGASAGMLTDQGARLLDPTGVLVDGIPLCPPEGDAGTGMVATNAVAPRTGNVSAGTSIFAMVVLERELSGYHPDIDMVTTPTGRPVAMVHCNNCTTELDAWVALFASAIRTVGVTVTEDELLPLLCRQALEGAPDPGGVLLYNHHAGEPICGLERGRPLLLREAGSPLRLPDLMRAHLYACFAPLALGLETLLGEEGVALDRLLGHGGLFKTPEVGQRLLAGAVGVPVSVMETAGEGGAWGMALLAAYLCRHAAGETLEDYLAARVFPKLPVTTLGPGPEDRAGFQRYLRRYTQGLAVERAAAQLPEEELC